MSVFKKITSFLGSVPIPCWLFAGGNVVYFEILLHLWVNQSLSLPRLLAVGVFALGFGSIVALLASVFGSRWCKWGTVLLTFLLGAFYLAEYFCQDAYKAFMSLGMILGGAKGVATDFTGVALGVILGGIGKILILMAPTLLFALFARPAQNLHGRQRLCIAGCAVLFYVLGLGIVFLGDVDAAKLSKSYNFDTSVRVFGLNMGIALDAVHGGRPPEAELDFEVPQAPELPEETEPMQPSQLPTEPEAEEVEYGYHTMEKLDFAALAESTPNSGAGILHRYINSLTPARENQYTGLFKGKNLILITAEAFTKQVIDPQLTPTLYRMATRGIQFTDYYQPAWGGSTTTGEFSNVVGMIPSTGGMCMNQAVHQDLFLTMGHQLQKLGYFSAAYHNHNANFYDRNKTHTHLGYDHFYARYGGLEGITPVWPESDLEMIDVTVPQYIDHQPFSIYYMTVSGHCGYSLKENAQARKNYDLVKDLDYVEAVKCYLASQLELEKAMTSLIKQLEDAGIADDTVIVIGTDHYPYGLERSTTWKNTADYICELYGVEKMDRFTRDSNALIIWSGCLEDMDLKVEEPVYSLDILPTLSNLFGVEYDSRLLVGRDVFSGEIPLVLWPDYSWKTDKGTYDATNGLFTPAQGASVGEDYIDYVSALVHNKFRFCSSVQSSYYFNTLSKLLK